MTTLPIVAALVLAFVGGAAAESTEEDDRGGVYRLEPTPQGNRMVLVPREEVKPGLAYSYYNDRLSRRVWGLAREDGTFQYAFGEGTMLPIERLDLGLPPEAEAQLLDEYAPGLRQRLAITGSTPAVVLTSEEVWRLLSFRTSARVFDIATGHRWEWHGDRRVAVVHTYGDRWQVIDGRYWPLRSATAVVPYGCRPLHRTGSAAYLTRTAEPER